MKLKKKFHEYTNKKHRIDNEQLNKTQNNFLLQKILQYKNLKSNLSMDTSVDNNVSEIFSSDYKKQKSFKHIIQERREKLNDSKQKIHLQIMTDNDNANSNPQIDKSANLTPVNYYTTNNSKRIKNEKNSDIINYDMTSREKKLDDSYDNNSKIFSPYSDNKKKKKKIKPVTTASVHDKKKAIIRKILGEKTNYPGKKKYCAVYKNKSMNNSFLRNNEYNTEKKIKYEQKIKIKPEKKDKYDNSSDISNDSICYLVTNKSDVSTKKNKKPVIKVKTIKSKKKLNNLDNSNNTNYLSNSTTIKNSSKKNNSLLNNRDDLNNYYRYNNQFQYNSNKNIFKFNINNSKGFTILYRDNCEKFTIHKKKNTDKFSGFVLVKKSKGKTINEIKLEEDLDKINEIFKSLKIEIDNNQIELISTNELVKLKSVSYKSLTDLNNAKNQNTNNFHKIKELNDIISKKEQENNQMNLLYERIKIDYDMTKKENEKLKNSDNNSNKNNQTDIEKYDQIIYELKVKNVNLKENNEKISKYDEKLKKDYDDLKTENKKLTENNEKISKYDEKL